MILLWLHMPDNEKFIFTGIIWSLLQRFDHKILSLVLITQDAILTVNGSILTLLLVVPLFDK